MAGKLGIGIIGLRMGYGHFNSLKDMPDVDLVAVCDLDEDLLEKVQRDFEVPLATTDYPGIGLSTVREPCDEIGRQAAQLMIDLIADPDGGPVHRLIPGHELIVRRTTQLAAG